jgi:dTDP-4-amino-4,6-dideoxygalactose transaminase
MIPLSRPTVTEEMKRAVLAVLDSGRFILGSETRAFEKEFAEYIGVREAVAVSTGTAAIQLALLAIGIRPGDEVLAPSMTAFPTIEGILHAGAVPVLADVDDHGCLDPEDAEKKVSARTVGIVPVHLYGGVADLPALTDLARRKNLWIVEDCCQAHGAMQGGRKVGSFGRAGCFSFYPSKNLTVLGDGGMVTTDDASLASTVRLLRDHGRSDKHTHVTVGYNLRFNEVQAAIGRRQLAELEDYVARRRAIAARYDEAFRDLSEVRIPLERPGTRMAYHLYPVRLADRAARDRLALYLKEHGIETGLHYPIPNHLQPAMAGQLPVPSLPRAEALADDELSLPIFPGLSVANVDEVIRSVRGLFGR